MAAKNDACVRYGKDDGESLETEAGEHRRD